LPIVTDQTFCIGSAYLNAPVIHTLRTHVLAPGGPPLRELPVYSIEVKHNLGSRGASSKYTRKGRLERAGSGHEEGLNSTLSAYKWIARGSCLTRSNGIEKRVLVQSDKVELIRPFYSCFNDRLLKISWEKRLPTAIF
jgi:hypothetical protein